MSILQSGPLQAVNEAVRFAWLIPTPRSTLSSSSSFAACLRKRAKLDASRTLKIAELMRFLAVLMSFLSSAFADPAKEVSDGPPPRISAIGVYSTLNRLGESERETTLREGKLLAHHRTADPFGVSIRGGLKDPVPVVEQPSATPAAPAPSNPTTQIVAAAVNVPTLEKAIQELTIGAVSLVGHQILVGSRSIREGDLVVLDSDGHQFSVWVQSVGVTGVLFCDTDLQKHVLKPFEFGPKELPRNSLGEVSDLRHLLDSDATH